MKKKFLLVGALLGVLTMAGCKDKKDSIKPTLVTPQSIDVIFDDGKTYIVFDEVPGAEYYNVSINGDIVTVRANGLGEIQFDASKLIGEPKDYVIKVSAGGKNYFDSAFTDEYLYNPDRLIDSPIVTIDGTTLNWSKVEGADFYEVFVTTPTAKQSFKSISNSFGFEKMLTVCGEYNFYVTAICQGKQNITSEKSNQIVYIHTETLITPHNLKMEYNNATNEEVLTFVSSENVEDFEIYINSRIYTRNDDINNASYWVQSEYNNVYIFRIGAFAKNNGIAISSETLLNVKVKANSVQPYLNNSQFSQSVTYQQKSVLEQPKISTSTNGSMCDLTIRAKDNKFLSQFVIYINGNEYKRIDASIKALQIPLNVINDGAIRVQSISNNNNCYDSNLSEGKLADGVAVNSMSLTKTGSEISWTKVNGATEYLVEISNARYRNSVNITDINTVSYNISNICEPGVYNVKVIALGRNSAEGIANVEFIKTLETPVNLELNTDNTRLYFEENSMADGYVLSIKHYSSQLEQDVVKEIPYLFTSSPIDISEYLLEAQKYEFKIKAISLINQYVSDSNFTDAIEYKNIMTLTAPSLKIEQEDDEFYLYIAPKAVEEALIDSYEVWVDYVKIDGLTLEDGKINITNYLQSAGSHNIMVKAIAIESDFLRDSSKSSITHVIYKQLDQVENIEVNPFKNRGRYVLSFETQADAVSYNVRIVKKDSNDYNVEFSTATSGVDITTYIRDKGTYQIYIQALAGPDEEFYTNSEFNSTPVEISKPATLQIAPGNILKKPFNLKDLI